MTRVCSFPGCDVVLVMDEGTRIERCWDHSGQRTTPEPEEKRIERVCRDFGWRRAR